MSTHCGIQHYCDESLWQHRHNSFHKEKQKLWQTNLQHHCSTKSSCSTYKSLFFFRNSNFLGANESIKQFRIFEFFQKHYLKIQCLKVLSCGNHDGRHRIQFHVPTMQFSKKAQILQFANSSYLVSCSFQEHCHSNKTSCQLTQLSYRIKGLFYLVNFHHFCGKNTYASDAF